MQPLAENSVNVPAFLGKLWKMVNDPETDHLISWNTAGNSFVIQNQAQFWYELLPVYYKHNNMSSFVRQLNMYGFHKVSSVENGTMDADKDEIIFFHPYFQKDKVELLRLIKRKVTGPKTEHPTQNNVRNDDITKVLIDVKQIKGRQASVDNQLSAMKQENAVLWRELALLRQKHMKQQQIVNKLIQFLLTLVQPSRMGVGVKRKYPLMLCERPTKKNKQNVGKQRKHRAQGGPTIHELDVGLELVKEELEEQLQHSPPLVHSPQTPNSTCSSASPPPLSYMMSQTQAQPNENMLQEPLSSSNLIDETATDPLLWDKESPATAASEEYILGCDGTEPSPAQSIESYGIQNNAVQPDVQKVFLNPSAQDTLLTNLINGNYNVNALNSNKNVSSKKMPVKTVQNTKEQDSLIDNSSLALSMKDPQCSAKIGNLDELHSMVGTTQSDLEQLKDILATCGGLDANALLGLFNDESPDYGLGSINQEKESELANVNTDPLLSGSELTPYGINMLDFNELFDDSAENQESNLTPSPEEANYIDSSTLNTPQVEPPELTFSSSKAY